MIAAAAKAGLRIIAIDVNNEALRKAKDVGATDVVNAKENVDVRKRVMELTGGMGADLTIDAAGFKQTCEDAVWTTRRGSRMVQVGLPIGGQDPAIPMGLVAGREVEIIGSHGCAAGKFIGGIHLRSFGVRHTFSLHRIMLSIFILCIVFVSQRTCPTS